MKENGRRAFSRLSQAQKASLKPIWFKSKKAHFFFYRVSASLKVFGLNGGGFAKLKAFLVFQVDFFFPAPGVFRIVA